MAGDRTQAGQGTSQLIIRKPFWPSRSTTPALPWAVAPDSRYLRLEPTTILKQAQYQRPQVVYMRLRSSWYLYTDVSVQPIGPIFTGQPV